jgi:hypothetical protein
MTGEPHAQPPKDEEPRPEDADDEEDGPSPFGLFPLLILLVLIVGGLLLMFKFHEMATIQDCVSSGRKNCAPISVPNER